jgi:hypothetical protein
MRTYLIIRMNSSESDKISLIFQRGKSLRYDQIKFLLFRKRKIENAHEGFRKLISDAAAP